MINVEDHAALSDGKKRNNNNEKEGANTTNRVGKLKVGTEGR